MLFLSSHDASKALAGVIADIVAQKQQANSEHQSLLLQGMIDRMHSQQEAYQEHLRMVHEAILAPKEIVKDSKTGNKTVRPVGK